LAEDLKWELAILATVQGFYTELLGKFVEGEVPRPAALASASLEETRDVRATLETMRRWLRLLDLAITPAMLRRALTEDTDPEIAEALLRYFTRAKDKSDDLRDKADLVATFLYRHPRVPGQWERQGRGLDGSLPLSPFEIALLEILADSDTPALSEEHLELIGRLPPLLEQAKQFRDLNGLVDSGIIASVRELKQSFGACFYHPSVLAAVALYNFAFGNQFHELFLASTAAIKRFASELEEQGGSILGSVDGVDVTVEDVARFDEAQLLSLDYSSALDRFRRISQVIRMLKRRPPVGRKPVPTPRPSRAKAGIGADGTAQAPPTVASEAPRCQISERQIAAEQTKLSKVEESIRLFVRFADPKFRHIVPMRLFNLTLSSEETEAYAADYLEQKSLRAELACALMRMAAFRVRMTIEVEELKRSQNSPSLRNLHADALRTLLAIEARLAPEVARLGAFDGRSGEGARGREALERSEQTLRACCLLARKALNGGEGEKAKARAAE
jgi:hypothetical protein